MNRIAKIKLNNCRTSKTLIAATSSQIKSNIIITLMLFKVIWSYYAYSKSTKKWAREKDEVMPFHLTHFPSFRARHIGVFIGLAVILIKFFPFTRVLVRPSWGLYANKLFNLLRLTKSNLYSLKYQISIIIIIGDLQTEED